MSFFFIHFTAIFFVFPRFVMEINPQFPCFPFLYLLD